MKRLEQSRSLMESMGTQSPGAEAAYAVFMGISGLRAYTTCLIDVSPEPRWFYKSTYRSKTGCVLKFLRALRNSLLKAKISAISQPMTSFKRNMPNPSADLSRNSSAPEPTCFKTGSLAQAPMGIGHFLSTISTNPAAFRLLAMP